MADLDWKSGLAFSPASEHAFSPSSADRGTAFAEPYVEIESAGRYPRISGGLSMKLNDSSRIDVGTERIPTERNPSYGANLSYRKAF
jgi:hypothetical protein